MNADKRSILKMVIALTILTLILSILTPAISGITLCEKDSKNITPGVANTILHMKGGVMIGIRVSYQNQDDLEKKGFKVNIERLTNVFSTPIDNTNITLTAYCYTSNRTRIYITFLKPFTLTVEEKYFRDGRKNLEELKALLPKIARVLKKAKWSVKLDKGKIECEREFKVIEDYKTKVKFKLEVSKDKVKLELYSSKTISDDDVGKVLDEIGSVDREKVVYTAANMIWNAISNKFREEKVSIRKLLTTFKITRKVEALILEVTVIFHATPIKITHENTYRIMGLLNLGRDKPNVDELVRSMEKEGINVTSVKAYKSRGKHGEELESYLINFAKKIGELYRGQILISKQASRYQAVVVVFHTFREKEGEVAREIAEEICRAFNNSGYKSNIKLILRVFKGRKVKSLNFTSKELKIAVERGLKILAEEGILKIPDELKKQILNIANTNAERGYILVIQCRDGNVTYRKYPSVELGGRLRPPLPQPQVLRITPSPPGTVSKAVSEYHTLRTLLPVTLRFATVFRYCMSYEKLRRLYIAFSIITSLVVLLISTLVSRRILVRKIEKRVSRIED